MYPNSPPTPNDLHEAWKLMFQGCGEMTIPIGMDIFLAVRAHVTESVSLCPRVYSFVEVTA